MAPAKDKNVRSIEDLTDEYKRLNERKIQAETQLKTATDQLESLQKDADNEFGTSDIGELKAKLVELETENEKRRSEYQSLLEKIAADLEKAEQQNTTTDTAADDTSADKTDAS